MKEVRCAVCRRPLKRRKSRKAGIGPTCMEKLRGGYSGIQLEAFQEFSIERWGEKITP